MIKPTYRDSALRTIQMEIDAVSELKNRIGDAFDKACELLLHCRGRVVVTGMGKSGHIANKIAATLASTGTPAFFVHPAEASHGDIGMITANDVVIALSNSGTTAELLTIVPLLKRLGIPLIAMTGNPASALAQQADVHLDAGVKTEACPLNLAPTSSTTVTLVLGDALAIALLEARGFTAEDFAFSHPGGALGRKLLLKVADIMHRGNRIPQVRETTHLRDALFEITDKGVGMTTVIDDAGKLIGVFTDGDLRRALDKTIDINTATIDAVMTRQCTTIDEEMLAAKALGIMETRKITSLVVVDTERKPVGVLHMHDILRAGVA